MTLAAFLLWSRLWGSAHADADQLRLAAAYHGVPTSVMLAVAAVESGYAGRNDVRGAAGEIGRMQIQRRTAQANGCRFPLENYGANIACGAKILRHCYERTGTWSEAVRCYNGPALPPSTKGYLGKVQQEIGRQWFARLDGG